MNYREYLHSQCKNCNLDDKEDVTMLIQFLLKEATDYHDLSLMMENKLKELMSAKSYDEWSTEKAKEKFKKEIDALPDDSDFKQWALGNFDKITGGDES